MCPLKGSDDAGGVLWTLTGRASAESTPPSAVPWPAQHGEVAEEKTDRSGDDVLAVFKAILPPQEIDRLCADCEVIVRQRQLNRGRLVRAMVIAAGTPGGAYQADSLRREEGHHGGCGE